MILPGPLSGNNPLVGWLNKLRAYARSCELKQGVGYKLRRGAEGTTLEIDVRGGGRGAETARFRLKSVDGDYMVCRTWNGTDEGTTDVKVAKPFLLRHSLASINYLGFDYTFTYSQNPAYPTVWSRLSVWTYDSSTETQLVVPPYSVNDEIYATKCETGVTDCDYLDDNRDARAWAGP